jgi:hypothetical protein
VWQTPSLPSPQSRRAASPSTTKSRRSSPVRVFLSPRARTTLSTRLPSQTPSTPFGRLPSTETPSPVGIRSVSPLSSVSSVSYPPNLFAPNQRPSLRPISPSDLQGTSPITGGHCRHRSTARPKLLLRLDVATPIRGTHTTLGMSGTLRMQH